MLNTLLVGRAARRARPGGRELGAAGYAGCVPTGHQETACRPADGRRFLARTSDQMCSHPDRRPHAATSAISTIDRTSTSPRPDPALSSAAVPDTHRGLKTRRTAPITAKGLLESVRTSRRPSATPTRRSHGRCGRRQGIRGVGSSQRGCRGGVTTRSETRGRAACNAGKRATEEPSRAGSGAPWVPSPPPTPAPGS